MKTVKLFLLTLFLGLFFSSCEKEPNPSSGPSAPQSSSRILLVGNEGSFNTNTASLSTIDLDNGTVQNNVYKNKNNESLGDVLQSITRIGAYYYFMVNNSNKIIVTDTNFNKKSEIKGIVSPRYMKAISSTRAYVTSLFNDKIYIIDLLSNTKISEIVMDKNWTEQLVLLGDPTGNYIYVCERDTAINYITKINVATDQIVDRIPIGGYAPTQIGITSDNHLWILAGNNFYGKIGTLTELDPSTRQIIHSFNFPANYTMGQMAIGPNNEKYVTVVDYNTNTYGVYKFNNGATTFPPSFFVNIPAAANFYGITVDPANSDVYISDSKGFTQAGAVNRYSASGVLLNSWTTAIGPSSFYFVQ